MLPDPRAKRRKKKEDSSPGRAWEKTKPLGCTIWPEKVTRPISGRRFANRLHKSAGTETPIPWTNSFCRRRNKSLIYVTGRRAGIPSKILKARHPLAAAVHGGTDPYIGLRTGSGGMVGRKKDDGGAGAGGGGIYEGKRNFVEPRCSCDH